EEMLDDLLVQVAAAAHTITLRPGTRRGTGGYAADAAAARRAASRRRRRSRRRSLSVMPPHTPSSWRLASAHSRHASRTGQPAHTSLAAPASASVDGKKIPVSRPLQAASSRHVVFT